MNINEKKVSMNRSGLDSRSTHYQSFTRSAVLALALVALIAVSVLPGYSSSHSLPSPIRRSRIEPEGLNVNAEVTPVLDTARAVTEIISTEGGTMTLTAGDGTRFTLSLPADALISDAEITMTPVSSAERLPLSGGLVAAVQLEPEGLRLWQPATLLIEPPVAISGTEEFPFAWSRMGEDFHLYPLQLDPSSLAMKLAHFCAYGIGRGSDADREAQQLREPINPEAGLEQRLQAALGEIRLHATFSTVTELGITEAQLSALDCSSKLAKAAVSVLQKDYKKGIKPSMKSALKSKNDEQLRCALSRALGWKEQVIAVGFEDCLAAQIQAVNDFMAKAINIQLDNAYNRCVNEHQAKDALLIMSLVEQADRLGVVINNKEKLKQCLKFELEFESMAKDTNEVYLTTVHAKVPVQYEFKLETTGEATLEYPSFTYRCPKDCSCTVRTADGALKVTIFFDLNLRDPGTFCSGGDLSPQPPVSPNPIVKITLLVLPLPRETITEACFASTVTSEPAAWFALFGHFHIGELTGDAPPGFEIRNWKASSGISFGTKQYMGCDDIACDDSSFDLKLAP